MLKLDKNLLVLNLIIIGALFLIFNVNSISANTKQTKGTEIKQPIIGQMKNVAEQGGYDVSIKDEKKIIPNYVAPIINAFLSLLGIVFLAYIIHGGYIWMIARGEEELVTRAKNIIKRAIIGLLVVISAWAITDFVLKRALGT